MEPRPQSLRDLREYPVLYVDDEPENLRIFELTFRREFEIFTASSGAEGLEVINTKPVALVLSDHRMPGMTGVEFLSRVCDLDPKTIRIMVTAYGDAETLSQAINDGAIYHFIAKPWQPDEVRATLTRGIEAYALERERAQLLEELAVLNRVSRELSGELQSKRVLEVLTSALRHELGFDGANVLLLDGERRVLRSAGNVSRDDPTTGLAISCDQAPELFDALRTGRSQALRLDQASYYPEGLRRWITEIAADEVLVTPLHGKDGLIGAVAVDNRRGGASLSGDDATLIEGLCNQAATAFENARLVGELRRSHEEMRRAERLGELGALAAGLVRELATPLEALECVVAEALVGDRGGRARADLERMRELLDSLARLADSATESAPAETVDLEETLAELFAGLRREAGHAGIGVELRVEGELPKVVAVRDQLRQAVRNLVQFAIETMPSGGTLRLAARAEDPGFALRLSHSGPGIEPARLEQLVDPFAPAGAEGAHVHLGLAMASRIIGEHGGSLELSGGAASEGEACFVVRWPRDARSGSA